MAKEKLKEKEEDAMDDGAKGEKDAGEKEPEAKEDAAAQGEGAAPKKGSKKKIIILGVLALVVLVGGAAGAYFAGLFGKNEEKPPEISADGKLIEKPVYYTMPEFLVNLNSGTRQTSFLKATIVLELSRAEDVPL
ncbi:MAG: hypothetical protein KGJ21_10820, partial [Pseudomonadota bacterium]|nr:hypothetical protein [Pseudomonadota bacterium]